MKKSSVLIILTAGLSAFSALAQPSGGGPDGDGGNPPPRRHHPPDLILKALDTNSDGIIDAGEIANAPAALKTLDKNGDGQLTVDEYMAHRPNGNTNTPPAGPDGKRPVPPLVSALDVNGDGIIDATEIANAPAELKTLDKNGDGQLTADEYRPHHPPFGGPPADGGDGGKGPPPGQ